MDRPLPTRRPVPALAAHAPHDRVAPPPADGGAADAGAVTQPGTVWQVRLLGALEVSCGPLVINRFPTRAVAALLARLALRPERAHPREELVELLWPGASHDVGRNRLRQTLSTLKSLLQGGAGGELLQADRLAIRTRPGALTSDVRQFEQLARAGDAAAARDAYGGELMPGYYEEWVIEERQRLAALFERMDQRVLYEALQWAGAAAASARSAAAAANPLALPSALLSANPAATAPATPPVVAPAPSGLPNFWTRSVGAELPASRLGVLVRQQRLVTVHGPGGSGKTRLAVEVARGLRDEPAPALQQPSDLQHIQQQRSAARFDRVTFVPLVDCVTAGQTLDAICSALQLEAGGGRAHTRIAATLAGGRTLLVLDNLEQLDGAACQAIAELLGAVPGLHVLATSRLLLDLDGEQAFALDGLALPNLQATLEEAAINPAVMLFVDRARAARVDFHLNAGNLQAVSGLVRLLGGMPLAIELAASRMRALTPAELLQRLSQDAGTPMLDLLARSTQRTTVGSRHASMRHVVDWSWRQLKDAQRALMGAMTVLGAPATLPAVAAVAGRPQAQTRLLLEELCDACLVRVVPGDAGQAGRYVQQQPVREFAAERWSADDARQGRHRLRRWLMDTAAQARPQGPAAVAAAITPELAHVHAAIVGAPGDGAVGEALDLALSLRSLWERDDLPGSAVLALASGLQGVTDAHKLSEMHELLAQASANAGQKDLAESHAQAAIAAARSAGDDRLLALALARWVWTRYYAGQLEAEPLLNTLAEASALARRSGDATAQATVLRVQAPLVCNLLLDYAEAEKLSEQAQLQWERAGDPAMARVCLLGRATMWAWQGREEQALPVYAQCEAAALADSDWVGALTAARQTGRVCIRLRRWLPAVVAFSRALHVGWQRRYARGLANTLLNMPEALLLAGQAEAAARLQGFALAHWARLFGPINRIEWAEQKRLRRLLRLRLGGPSMAALRAQGAVLELPQAVALAQDSAAHAVAPASP